MRNHHAARHSASVVPEPRRQWQCRELLAAAWRGNGEVRLQREPPSHSPFDIRLKSIPSNEMWWRRRNRCRGSSSFDAGPDDRRNSADVRGFMQLDWITDPKNCFLTVVIIRHDRKLVLKISDVSSLNAMARKGQWYHSELVRQKFRRLSDIGLLQGCEHIVANYGFVNCLVLSRILSIIGVQFSNAAGGQWFIVTSFLRKTTARLWFHAMSKLR